MQRNAATMARSRSEPARGAGCGSQNRTQPPGLVEEARRLLMSTQS
jgi:hypothetical protein